jgi:hypothetical protein
MYLLCWIVLNILVGTRNSLSFIILNTEQINLDKCLILLIIKLLKVQFGFIICYQPFSVTTIVQNAFPNLVIVIVVVRALKQILNGESFAYILHTCLLFSLIRCCGFVFRKPFNIGDAISSWPVLLLSNAGFDPLSFLRGKAYTIKSIIMA